MLRLILLLCYFVFSIDFCLAQEGKPISIDQGKIWSRTGKATFDRDGNAYRIVNPNFDDWSVSAEKQYPVQPGDIITMTGKIRLEGAGVFSPSVVTRNAKGDVIEWVYGARQVGQTDGKVVSFQSTFVIPLHVTSIEPRLMGWHKATVHYSGFSIQRTGRVKLDPKTTPLKPIENKYLKVAFSESDERFAVYDKRSKRTWTPEKTGSDWIVLRRRALPFGARITMHSASAMLEVEATVTLEKNAPEIAVQLSGKGEMLRSVVYPSPFTTRQGDRIILPMNEGIGVPVDEPPGVFGHFSTNTYSGHGLCMAFYGVTGDATGDGYMGIFETADDSGVELRIREGEKLRPQARWDTQKRQFGYPRKLRLAFFDQGGHVAMAKRYRQHAKETGLLVTFKEKIEKNPKLKDGIDKLLGAANIWFWEGNRGAFAKELHEAGIDRLLWSQDSSPQEIEEINNLENVLTGCYDMYTDLLHPDMYPELDDVSKNNHWRAWPDDVVWTDSKGTWAKGWGFGHKSGKLLPGALLCDLKAPEYARRTITSSLTSKSYSARFIDVTTAADWRECWNPKHPMTRTDSKKARMRLLEMIGKEFNLVCGSETGHDAAVPYCDYFEGMMSLVHFRVPDSGRDMAKVWDEVPELLEKYQVGQAYRLPLWELVYHDCCVAMWYWGDYNNKLPKVWAKRDLFNALYGTPPMYLLNRKQWAEEKERFVASSKVAMPVARMTAYKEMLDHQILKPDRTIQQTEFEGGIVVTVNFGDASFKMKDGFQLEGMTSRIENRTNQTTIDE